MSNNNPERVAILYEAADLIVGQRQKDYGTPEENFQRIADYWNIKLKGLLKDDAKITARIVAEMMLLLKVARTANSPTRDTYLDLAGYAGIAAELANNDNLPNNSETTWFCGEKNPLIRNLNDEDDEIEIRVGDIWAIKVTDPSTWWIWDGKIWVNYESLGDSK